MVMMLSTIKHNGVGVMEISNILVMREDFSLEPCHLSKYGCGLIGKSFSVLKSVF